AVLNPLLFTLLPTHFLLAEAPYEQFLTQYPQTPRLEASLSVTMSLGSRDAPRQATSNLLIFLTFEQPRQACDHKS
ncbi:hypothetical protein DFH94DRAFT_731726, partial [Russula ochroleuca]